VGKDRTTNTGNGKIAKNINYFELLHPLFKSGVVKRIEHTKNKIFVKQLDGNLLAGAEVVFGAENTILAGCVETNIGIIDVEMDIPPEMFVDLLPAFDKFAPCAPKSRRAPVIYKNGKRLFRTKRPALVRSADCILLAGAYVGVSDGNWFIHGFAQGRPDMVANGVGLTEDEARRVLYDAGYFDFTDPCDRDPSNYPRPRPRTAPRKRCPNAGQASLLGSMGVSDDR
jgi:hypothetical protein